MSARRRYAGLQEHIERYVAGASALISAGVVYATEHNTAASIYKVGINASYPLVAGKVLRHLKDIQKVPSDLTAQLLLLGFNAAYSTAEALGYSYFGSDRPVELALLFGVPAHMVMAGLTHALRHPGLLRRAFGGSRRPAALEEIVEIPARHVAGD